MLYNHSTSTNKMSGSDNEWGFFVDLENYSNFSELRPKEPFFKNILETKLHSIQESEEIYYDFQLKEAEENICSNFELKENEKLNSKETTKTEYYISIGIMITGFSLTFLMAYYDII
jgi:hypothetical protein